MKENVINNLNGFPYSERNGSYGGMAGSKDGLLINGEYWMIKYPKSTKGMRGLLPSYTSSPLSEYIGSHVYGILGYDVHQTYLGIRNDKIVVACKDFCKSHGDLRELRTLKNAYNKELEEKLNTSLNTTGSSHIVDLNEILIHLKYNPLLSNISGLTDRFWDCVIIDGLINNNDRNNGNWGLLYEDGEVRIAPIFDNGGSFSSKLPDEKIMEIISNHERMMSSSLNTTTAFGINEQQLSFKDLIEEGLKYSEFACALKRNVSLIRNHMSEITAFINNIPEYYEGLNVCSKIRKSFYIKGMEMRLDNILLPALQKIVSKKPSLDNQICECKNAVCIHTKSTIKEDLNLAHTEDSKEILR